MLLKDWPPQNTQTKTDPLINLVSFPATLGAEQWADLFAAVASGEGAVIGAFYPEDIEAIREFNRRGIKLELQPGIGSWMGCSHWIPDSDLFSGLPAGGLAKKPYAEFIPKYVFSEMGGEVLAGSLRNTQSRQEAPSMLWYSDIEAVRLGKGLILLCQYRIFGCLDRDPLAARLAYNAFQFVNQSLQN